MSNFLVIDSNKVIHAASKTLSEAQMYLEHAFKPLEKGDTAKIVEAKKGCFD